ncbi:MAG: transporter substrate-binding domain-containing protein [Pseudomonadota bacterium]
MQCRPTLVFFALLLPCLAGRAAEPHALTFCYEDVEQRPWSTPAGTGLNFELLKRVESRLGERFMYVARPWKRCLEEVRLGTIDGAIGAGESVERRKFAVYPELPGGEADPARALFTDDVHVFLRVGGRASWDGTQLRAPSGEVVVQSSYLVAEKLRQRGFAPKERVKSAADALRLLASGIYDVAILEGIEASRLARDDPRFNKVVTRAPVPYELEHFHLMISRITRNRDPDRVEAIWNAIGAVHLAEDYRKLEAAEGVGR